MRLRIYHKVLLGMLITSGLALAALVLSFGFSLRSGFVAYLNALEGERQEELTLLLEAWYEDHGDWERLRNRPRAWHSLIREAYGLPDSRAAVPAQDPPDRERGPDRPRARPGEMPGPPMHPPREPDPALVGLVNRLSLEDAEGHLVIGPGITGLGDRRIPIRIQQIEVGWLVAKPLMGVTETQDRAFLEQQMRFVALVCAGLIVMCAVTALLLARHFNRPVAALALASRKLMQGDFGVRVQPRHDDEIGQLARDFNHMAAALEEHRTARRRGFADISHELRTPLTILRGELDALEDGIRPLDQAALGSIRAEVERLGTMVNDLYELSLSDLGALEYHMREEDVFVLLEDCVRACQKRAEECQINVELMPLNGNAVLLVDAKRVAQLFNNLLENALRYTDPPGRIRCQLSADVSGVVVTVDDSPPGVPEALHDKLFQRLFRVDRSRSRKHGGAGLGLAICANVVKAHGGRIQADASPLGGLRISLHLPR